MKVPQAHRFIWQIAIFVSMVSTSGCGSIAATEVASTATPPLVSASSPVPANTEPAAPDIPTPGTNWLFHDDFTDPATGWPEDKFDNYFIGYHEPEYYHIEVTGAHYKTTVFEPGKQTYDNFTAELQVLTAGAKTAPEGDFRYGLAFRRSGDQYYAFTISPRAKKWFVLKSSPNRLAVLSEGTDATIHDLDIDDTLRVDVQGPDLFFHINDQMVGQVTDADYTTGELGFYVESFDAANTHIHFDALTVRDFEAPAPGGAGAAVLYQDDFNNPATGWTERKFDNYFIGYHEPEYYHVEVSTANYKTTVFEPQKESFGDFTAESQVFAVAAKTSPEGDFRYGVAFRRSGDQYYAFAISPRSKKWYVLKSSPSGLKTLQEGEDPTIHELDAADLLRVDAQGSNFLFHINDKLISQVTDVDYAGGEVGLYVETFDATNTHIHFDKLAIRELSLSLACDVRGGTLYVRSGPGKNNSQVAVLSDGDSVKALGISPNRWIKIAMEGSESPGWVSYEEGFITCSPGVDLFPVVNP